jgi:hypothetical protein
MIGVIIGGLLDDSVTLSALVNDRIYPYAIDEDVALPAIIYKIDSTIPTYTKDGREYDISNISVIAFATSYKTVLDITAGIRQALELYKGGYSGSQIVINSSRIESISEGYDFENNVYTTQTTFEVKYK